MSKDAPIEVPREGGLQWALQNPVAISEAVELLNKLSTSELSLADSSSSRGRAAFVISDENAVLVIPVLWSGGVPSNIASYFATADATYSQTQVQALCDQVALLTNALNTILSEERAWQTKTRS